MSGDMEISPYRSGWRKPVITPDPVRGFLFYEKGLDTVT